MWLNTLRGVKAWHPHQRGRRFANIILKEDNAQPKDGTAYTNSATSVSGDYCIASSEYVSTNITIMVWTAPGIGSAHNFILILLLSLLILTIQNCAHKLSLSASQLLLAFGNDLCHQEMPSSDAKHMGGRRIRHWGQAGVLLWR